MQNIPEEVEEEESESDISNEFSDYVSISYLQLNPIESHLVQCVLNDTIRQIDIFTGGVHIYQNISFQDMKERFVKPIKYTIFDPETSQRMDTSFELRSKLKLQKDKGLLLKLLCNMRDELQVKNCYGMVANFMRQNDRKKKMERNLEKEYWARKAKVYHMKKIIADTRRHKKRLTRDKIVMAEALLDKLQDVSQRAAIEFQYVKKYESVRAEQNHLVCKRQERELRKDIAGWSETIEDEMRVHEAIIIYLQFACSRLEEKIDYWTEKYNQDIENKDIMIANLKQKRSEGADQLQELHDQFKEREQEILQFLEILEEKQRQEELKRHRIAMAIKIQAWWRGTMVRAQLGPFSRTKKHPKKEKKKKY